MSTPDTSTPIPPAPPVPTGAPPKGKARRWLWIGAGIAILAVVGVAAVLLFGGSSGHTIKGTILLSDTAFGDYETLSINVESDGSCWGTGGYNDMQAGADVRVRDGSGDLIATSSLGPGNSPDTDVFADAAVCTFKFYVDDVPDADFYSVEVAHRGEVTYSLADMEENNWKVELSLGE